MLGDNFLGEIVYNQSFIVLIMKIGKLKKKMEQYLDSSISNIYEQRILAFVDILGFKNMVEGAVHNKSEQERILTAMRIVRRYKDLNDSDADKGLNLCDCQVTTFSDSAIISYPLHYDGGFFGILIDLIHMQIDLLSLGIFIRGGIAIGLAYHNKYNAFGPAMNEAYKFESQKAIYPRIIFTEDTIIKGIRNSPSHNNRYDIDLVGSLIKKDEDGYYFLDYLRQSQEFDYPSSDYYKWMQMVRKAIIINLNNSHSKDEKVYQKYLWVLKYWNEMLDPENIDCPVDGDMSWAERKGIYEDYMDLRIDPEVIPYE